MMDTVYDWQLDDSLTEEQIRAAMAADGMRPVEVLAERPPAIGITVRGWALGAEFTKNEVSTYGGLRIDEAVSYAKVKAAV